MVLGIVGKIGSGKSTAIEFIEKNYDAIVFSCDEIAKDIMKKGETDYDPGFAGEIFISEKKQEECRTLLHPIVFNRIIKNINNINHKNSFFNSNTLAHSASKALNKFFENFKNYLNKLSNNNLIHINNYNNIYCENNLNNFLNKTNKMNKKNFSEKLIIIESALPSDDMYKMCDKVIYIDSSYEDRVKRLQESRGYSESKIKLIYDSQEYYEKYYDKADYKINNNGSKEEFLNKITEVLNEIYITSK